MKTISILDFSVYGNPVDPQSDALLVKAATTLGLRADLQAISPEKSSPRAICPAELCATHGSKAQNPSLRAICPASDAVWLRFDVRSPQDLDWIVAQAEALVTQGCRVFPEPQALRCAEDKWETWKALKRLQIPTPLTLPISRIHQLGFPAMCKKRVGWGAMGCRVVHTVDDLVLRASESFDSMICQPYIPHTRTLIVAMAGASAVACIEDIGGGMVHSGRVGCIAIPDGAAQLAAKALVAVGLPAGTVDVIETPDGLQVLEVNAAPRLFYPDIPGQDITLPMVREVCTHMKLV